MSFGIPVRNGLSIGLLASTFLSSGGRLVPRLSLNFLAGGTLDPRITFTRSSTATFVGSDGLIQTAAIDTPRFDYDPITLAPKGLLIEEQRENLLLRSEEFDNAGWTKTNSTITANATTAPDGTLTGDKHVPNLAVTMGVGATETRVFQSPSATTGISYTFTIYAKEGEFDQIEFGLIATPTVTAKFSLNLGTVISGSGASIEPAGNGWYRCSLTVVAGVTGALAIRWSANDSVALVGDGTSGIFVWGAQFEAGAFATSYIPTVTVPVTRDPDNAEMTGTNFSSWYNASEGSIVVSADSFRGTPGSARTFTFNDGTSGNNIRTGGQSTLQVIDTGTPQCSIAGTPLIPFDGTVFKFASAYKANDFVTVTTGVVDTDPSGTIPTVNQLLLGSGETTATFLNGHIRTITYYTSRLTNAQLQALTT